LNKEDSLSRSIVSDISDNNINYENKFKNRFYNKTKDFCVKKGKKKEEISISNITNSDNKKNLSYIEKTEYNTLRRRDNNGNTKCFDNSLETRRKSKNNNASKNVLVKINKKSDKNHKIVDKPLNDNADEKEDELKDFWKNIFSTRS